MAYNSMIQLAEKADNNGVPLLANIIFAILLMASRDPRSGLYIQWETSDPEGRNPSQEFNDVIYVCFGSCKVCLPARMVQTTEKVAALKKAEIIAPQEHKLSSPRPPAPHEEKILWDEFKALTTEQVASIAICSVFTETYYKAHEVYLIRKYE